MLGEQILGIVNAFSTIVLTCCLLAILTSRTEWKFSKEKAIVLGVVELITLTIVFWVVLTKVGMDLRGKATISVILITSLVVGYLGSTVHRKGKNIFVVATALCIMSALSSMGEIISPESAPWRIAIKILICILIIYQIYFRIRHPFLQITSEIQEGWKRLALIPFSLSTVFIVLLLTGRLYYDRDIQLIAVLLCGVTIFIFCVSYYLLKSMKEQHMQKEEYAILKEQMLSLKKQSELIRQANEKMHIFRHDMRHYLQIIGACIQEGRREEALDILNQMPKNLADVAELEQRVDTYTGNILIDAVLSNYAERAEEEGIQFEVKMCLSSELEKNPLEFAVVIANGLENALHACQAMEAKDTRTIRIQGIRNKQQFFLTIDNTYDGQIQFREGGKIPISLRAGHGFGTKSIMAFVAEKNAMLDFYTKNGWFKCRIIFDLKV